MIYANPAELGFDAAALEAAWAALVRGAEAGAYGGAVALVARQGGIALHRATGWAVREPFEDRSPIGTDAIFDLASLTKVTATLPSILALVAADRLGLEQPVGEVLPEFGRDVDKREVTIRRLLAHTAGLLAWRAFYLDGVGIDAYLAAIADGQPERTPGQEALYSDPSFILLGEVVRRVSGASVADFAARTVFGPLGMTDTCYLPPRTMRSRIAATERGNPFEAAKEGDRAGSFDGWRTGLIRGEVHDGNAWYGLGGVAGHAGLFGTARDLARYGQCWLNGGELGDVRLLPADLVAEATTEQPPAGSNRALGWRTAPPGDEVDPTDSGRGLGPRAFGHTGFTGTSLWVDPDLDLVLVLLTNRVHPEVRDDYLPIRSAFTAAVAAAAG